MLPKTKKDFLDSFRQKCKEHHLSMTPQRLAVYEMLIEAKNHPGTEDVFHHVKTAFPDISIDTVYRTLTTFSEIGIVHVVEGYGEAKRYDPDMEPHHHFRCRRCGRIVDFHEAGFDNLKIPASIRKKYRISNIKVILEGVCDFCFPRKG